MFFLSNGCQRWESKKGTPEYESWKIDHVCQQIIPSHLVQWKQLEPLTYFSRSVEKHKLIYKDYIGDGDTSSFKEVVEAEPLKIIK